MYKQIVQFYFIIMFLTAYTLCSSHHRDSYYKNCYCTVTQTEIQLLSKCHNCNGDRVVNRMTFEGDDHQDQAQRAVSRFIDWNMYKMQPVACTCQRVESRKEQEVEKRASYFFLGFNPDPNAPLVDFRSIEKRQKEKKPDKRFVVPKSVGKATDRRAYNAQTL